MATLCNGDVEIAYRDEGEGFWICASSIHLKFMTDTKRFGRRDKVRGVVGRAYL
jgi:hypothetical protein